LLLRVSEKTIRRMIDQGRLNAFRLGATEKGSYRIPYSEVNRLAMENYIKHQGVTNEQMDGATS